MSSYQYRKFHCGDKTVAGSSYLHNGISYTGKMSSLYWIRALLVSLPSVSSLLHGSNLLPCNNEDTNDAQCFVIANTLTQTQTQTKFIQRNWVMWCINALVNICVIALYNTSSLRVVMQLVKPLVIYQCMFLHLLFVCNVDHILVNKKWADDDLSRVALYHKWGQTIFYCS